MGCNAGFLRGVWALCGVQCGLFTGCSARKRRASWGLPGRIQMNNRRTPRRAAEVASFGELRGHYDTLVKQLDETSAALRLARTSHRGDRRELEDSRTKVEKAEQIAITLTAKQKAADEAKSAGLWSGMAGVAVTLLYETWKVIGFPGGYKWMAWWNHEAVFGILMWISTYCFATAYKLSREHNT